MSHGDAGLADVPLFSWILTFALSAAADHGPNGVVRAEILGAVDVQQGAQL
jgi:hypothetical protein